MTLMGHNESDSDVHVLQKRRGCEVEVLPSGNGTFLRVVDEYGYDGENFISFNISTMEWETSVDWGEDLIKILDDLQGLRQYIKDILTRYCVDKINEFGLYQTEYLRNKSVPDVFVFAKRSPTPTTVVLTCWAAGFYLRDVSVIIRRNGFPVPETNRISSEVRPNGDGTYQLWKSVEIPESEKADYDCYVNYRILKEPIIAQWVTCLLKD
ncbi:H-2 class I histocompatibility antigen, Q10 alpha chain-like [Chanos chanos]|uniref:H-2 class I histocompatibility antigen, Q10 alpha chain-like n=1 Tax=Chanos chanos TaxID=29144 RepID=A0A6J2WKZ8_CHACN|nr:H-2 class I histocompatibility antigen, Q10 alpha chain-like [Chanos chanos]